MQRREAVPGEIISLGGEDGAARHTCSTSVVINNPQRLHGNAVIPMWIVCKQKFYILKDVPFAFLRIRRMSKMDLCL